MLEKLYEQIDKLRDGNERVCDRCGEILKSKYFPYKSINLCLWCYEKNHNIILRTLRKKLRLSKFAIGPSKILRGLLCPYCGEETITREGSIYVCSICSSEVNVKKKHIQKIKPKLCPACGSSQIRKARLSNNNHNEYFCKNCQSIWDFAKTKKGDFIRKTSVEKILSYLKNQKENNEPIEFYYRDDIKPRKIYDYFLDDKYINVKSDKGYFIKFLIDRIKKI